MSAIEVPTDKIAEFCRKWSIVELSLFGSVLRDDFGPESDVDVLVTFTEEANWDITDLVDMQEELSEILGRKADFVMRECVEASRNLIRRRHILNSLEPIYVARGAPLRQPPVTDSFAR